MVLVPHTALDPKTLAALIEEFLTRDGAVHGHQDRLVAHQADSIMKQLETKAIAIVFDETEETCTIVRREDLPATMKKAIE